MKIQDMMTLYEYNYWATRRILATGAKVSLEQRWYDEEMAMRDYLASLTDDDLTHLVRYTTGSGQKRERVLWHCLLHGVNHGTHHRSEAAAILTGYGQSPGDLDFTVFLNEQR